MSRRTTQCAHRPPPVQGGDAWPPPASNSASSAGPGHGAGGNRLTKPLSDYQRKRDLPRLMALLAVELETPTRERHARLLGLIRRALRAERRRGLAADWCYDPGRHAGLLLAWRSEFKTYQRQTSRHAAQARRADGRPSVRPGGAVGE